MCVHTRHCCNHHGCKYGESDCPVANGKLKQEYPCEECWVEPALEEDGHKTMERIKKKVMKKQNKLNLYMFKTPDGLYLAEMKSVDPTVTVYGAVDPVTSANYYNRLDISPIKESGRFTMGMDGWLDWLIKEALPKGWAKIDEEFPFDPKKLKVITLKEE